MPRQFADARRTLIQAEKRAVAEVKVVDEPVTVVVSQKGWVRARQAHGHDAGRASLQVRRRRCTAPSNAARSTRC
jgi:DNA gyrase/topoisomerase IV subunit A